MIFRKQKVKHLYVNMCCKNKYSLAITKYNILFASLIFLLIAILFDFSLHLLIGKYKILYRDLKLFS